METISKTEENLLNLDDLFRLLGERVFLLTKTAAYLESLQGEKDAIIKLIDEIENGKQKIGESVGDNGEPKSHTEGNQTE